MRFAATGALVISHADAVDDDDFVLQRNPLTTNMKTFSFEGDDDAAEDSTLAGGGDGSGGGGGGGAAVQSRARKASTQSMVSVV